MGSKNNPGAFDCYANAAPDEPMFILLARDPMAAPLVRAWADMRARGGEDPAKVREAEVCADAMEQWARDIGKGVRVDEAAAQLVEIAESSAELATALVEIDYMRIERDSFSRAASLGLLKAADARAEVERLRVGIQEALSHSGNRWSEWGERACGVAEILSALLIRNGER